MHMNSQPLRLRSCDQVIKDPQMDSGGAHEILSLSLKQLTIDGFCGVGV